ncbi:MAG: lytic transglycosylase domain-containing protein [Treponema sp.]|nr:lytic transglycosylase domain-containing protein [Treponema sp.]
MDLSFRKIDIEFVIPLFAGVFCSLFACTMAGIYFDLFPKPVQTEAEVVIEEEEEEEEEVFLFSVSEVIPDPVLEYYRNPEYREWVIDFFAVICSRREIALAILDSADEFNVPPALAFALSWEESRFNHAAVNRGNRDGSVDRGLFQLNNRSFPNLDIASFFNINSNARYGVSHLRYCLDTGGTEISALAIYNAGAGRVRSTGAPHVTLNYISRILENRRRIETRFHSRLIREEESRLAEAGIE